MTVGAWLFVLLIAFGLGVLAGRWQERRRMTAVGKALQRFAANWNVEHVPGESDDELRRRVKDAIERGARGTGHRFKT